MLDLLDEEKQVTMKILNGPRRVTAEDIKCNKQIYHFYFAPESH